MISSPTSDGYRLRRALLDPWALGLALAVGLAAAALGWDLSVAVLVVAVVIVARVAAEYAVPRSVRQVELDSIGLQTERIRASLDRAATAATELPAEARQRVRAIRVTVLEVLERPDLRVDVTQIFTILSTATDYLPAALGAYLRLPADYRERRQLADGRTPLAVLVDQLDVLQREMVAVADAVAASDLDRLLAHGKFLADRFGLSELTFNTEEVSNA